MSLGARLKDPDETRTYTFDWTAHLADPADTIATATITVPDGLTKVSDGIVSGNKKASVTVSGGVLGEDYPVVCTITTATSAETFERTGTIRVRSL